MQLNQALINYGLEFLADHKCKDLITLFQGVRHLLLLLFVRLDTEIQPPFFMRKASFRHDRITVLTSRMWLSTGDHG